MQHPLSDTDLVPRSKSDGLLRKKSCGLLWSIGLILAGGLVGVFTLSRRSGAGQSTVDLDAEREAMRAIGAATHQWQVYFGDAVCPSIRQLVERKALDATVRKVDSWDQPYVITCMDTEIIVKSAGPDRARATPDDVVLSVPRRR